MTIPPGFAGLPLHVHPAFDELHRQPARVLLNFTPGGHERDFEAMAAALRDGDPTPEFFSALMADLGITPV
jgi:hypothetical protein